MTLTIKGADEKIRDAIVSICRLRKGVRVTAEELSLADEILRENERYETAAKSGTLQTFADMSEYERAHDL